MINGNYQTTSNKISNELQRFNNDYVKKIMSIQKKVSIMRNLIIITPIFRDFFLLKIAFIQKNIKLFFIIF